MDISSVLGPAAGQTSQQKPGDAVNNAVLEKAMDKQVTEAATLVTQVATPAQEVPSDKLPAHLGRNIDVTA